jgi:TPR repeat protein
MSVSADQSPDAEAPESFAPKRIREAAREVNQNVSSFVSDKSDDLAWSLELTSALIENATREHELASEGLPLPPTLQATQAEAPVRVARTRHRSSSLLRPMLVVPAVGGFALLILGTTDVATWIGGASKSGDGINSFWLQPPAQLRTQHENRPRLDVNQPAPKRKGEASSLGASVHDLRDGGLVVVRGLANGATLSKGSFVSDNDWWLSAMELDDVVIQPAPQFIGTMEITVELRLADTSLSDQRTLRFEWAEPADREEAKTASEAGAMKSQAPRRVPSEQIAALVKRGEDLIASGDFAAARLVLQRAAEAGDAHAALLLAGTYDPMMLEKLQVHGFAPDVNLARHWYEKADELGSRDATGRLKVLLATNKPE